jgi:hypothetical protein
LQSDSSLRSLSAAELAMAAAIFGTSLDCRPVRLTRDSLLSVGAPKALCNTIHLRSDWGHFVGDTLTLTAEGRATLVHELAHVWQYQSGGLAYIPASLSAQLLAWARTGSRAGAYRWREALDAGRPWAAWNPEQQAQAIEAWAVATWRIEAGVGGAMDAHCVALLAEIIAAVRRGEGAARFW